MTISRFGPPLVTTRRVVCAPVQTRKRDPVVLSRLHRQERANHDQEPHEEAMLLYGPDTVQIPTKEPNLRVVLSAREAARLAQVVPDSTQWSAHELLELVGRMLRDKKRIVRRHTSGHSSNGNQSSEEEEEEEVDETSSSTFLNDVEADLDAILESQEEESDEGFDLEGFDHSDHLRPEEMEGQDEHQHAMDDHPQVRAIKALAKAELASQLQQMNNLIEEIRHEQHRLEQEKEQLLEEMEQKDVEQEELRQQIEFLHDTNDQYASQIAEMVTKTIDCQSNTTVLKAQLNKLRQETLMQVQEIEFFAQEEFQIVLEKVYERERLLQESYAQEKKERQLIAEKYHELSGRIRVFCRLRPPFGAIEDSALMHPKPNSVLVTKNAKEFHFDRVFGLESTQEQVYEHIEPIVTSFADGFNACIMAYGQTGSGKTHTMMGPSGSSGGNQDRLTDSELDDSQEGVVPRALKQVFRLVNSRELSYEDTLTVSMVEIYNDQLRDLLSEERENPILKTENDMTQRQVTKWDDVHEILEEGNASRQIGCTQMNIESSRSHAMVFITLVSQHRETKETRRSTLCLVDLAGSERVSRSKVHGDRLKETQHINKSLSALGDVIHALQTKSKHIPFRNSKLTFLLKDMLSGSAKCLLMLQLSPEQEDVDETICSLAFGARVSQIQLGSVKMSSESGDLYRLRNENNALVLQKEQLLQEQADLKQLVDAMTLEMEEMAKQKQEQLELMNDQQQHLEDLEHRCEHLELEVMQSHEREERALQQLEQTKRDAASKHQPENNYDEDQEVLMTPIRTRLPQPKSSPVRTSKRSSSIGSCSPRSIRSTGSNQSASDPLARSSTRSTGNGSFCSNTSTKSSPQLRSTSSRSSIPRVASLSPRTSLTSSSSRTLRRPANSSLPSSISSTPTKSRSTAFGSSLPSPVSRLAKPRTTTPSTTTSTTSRSSSGIPPRSATSSLKTSVKSSTGISSGSGIPRPRSSLPANTKLTTSRLPMRKTSSSSLASSSSSVSSGTKQRSTWR